MKDETSPKIKPPSRRLSFPARMRASFRRGRDRVLGADLLWSGIFVGVVVLLIGSQSCERALPEFAVGEVARQDLRAPFDIDVVDEVLTDERRRDAAEAIPDVYVYDMERGVRLAEELAGRGSWSGCQLRATVTQLSCSWC